MVAGLWGGCLDGLDLGEVFLLQELVFLDVDFLGGVDFLEGDFLLFFLGEEDALDG